MVTGSGGAIRNKEEEEKDTASGGAPTHRNRHRHRGPRLARRRGTMAAQFAWFPADGLHTAWRKAWNFHRDTKVSKQNEVHAGAGE